MLIPEKYHEIVSILVMIQHQEHDDTHLTIAYHTLLSLSIDQPVSLSLPLVPRTRLGIRPAPRLAGPRRKTANRMRGKAMVKAMANRRQ